MSITVEGLNPTVLPTRNHVVPAMLDGITVKLTLGQILDLLVAGAPTDLDTWLELVGRLENYNSHLESLDGDVAALQSGKQPLDAMLTALAALTAANGKFLAFNGADAPAVRDIVGTVSQTGGVPTGAIIESGSNANGSYTRWADGTQICSFTGFSQACNVSTTPIYMSNEDTWTYPAAFVAVPRVFPASTLAVRWAAANPSLTSASVRQYQTGSSATGSSVQLLAIGRWFA